MTYTEYQQEYCTKSLCVNCTDKKMVNRGYGIETCDTPIKEGCPISICGQCETIFKYSPKKIEGAFAEITTGSFVWGFGNRCAQCINELLDDGRIVRDKKTLLLEAV